MRSGDGDIGDDQVGLAGLQQQNAVGGLGGDQLQQRREIWPARFGRSPVVTDDFMRFRIYRTERRVGVEGGDFDHRRRYQLVIGLKPARRAPACQRQRFCFLCALLFP